MTEQQFEERVALQKAAESIKEEVIAHAGNKLGQVRKLHTRQVVGYEHQLRSGEIARYNDCLLTMSEMEELLTLDLRSVELNLIRLFGTGYRALRAPAKASLIELGHYLGPMTFAKVPGLRQAVAHRKTTRVISRVLARLPAVVRLISKAPHKRRFRRILQQLDEGRFIPAEITTPVAEVPTPKTPQPKATTTTASTTKTALKRLVPRLKKTKKKEQ